MSQVSIEQMGVTKSGVDDIKQSIDIILSTYKGEDPLRPNFGCRILDYLDKPETQVFPGIKKEIVDALTTYEPRIRIVKIVQEWA